MKSITTTNNLVGKRHDDGVSPRDAISGVGVPSVGTVVVEDGVVSDHICDRACWRHGLLVSKEAARQSLHVEIRVFDSVVVEPVM